MRKINIPFLALSLISIVIWTIVSLVSLFWNIKNIQDSSITLATAEARANWNKDQAFRGWATLHGGLYVVPNDRTPPNPYLAHLPKRDVVTTDGVKLTLMNPAYMMRQMTEEYEELYGVKGSITGKVLLNPINKADEWEFAALERFDRGVTEVVEKTSIDNVEYLRLMKPLIMKKGCVKCHGHLGFIEGDIRGGVSVSIPLEPYNMAVEEASKALFLTHFTVWLMGLMGISLFIYYARMQHLELKRAHSVLEDRVKKRTKELRESEARLRMIMNTAADAIITINDRGLIESFNASAESMFGYKESEVIGENVSLLTNDRDKGQHDNYLKNYQKTGEAKIIGIGREVVAKTSSGREFPIHLSVSKSVSGNKLIYTGIIHDISDRKKYERNLYQAKAEAESANKSKSIFLSSMSHELRTPLNSILGFSQLLEIDPTGSLSEDQKEAITFIRSGGEHLLELITQVLDLSKIESGNITTSIESIKVSSILNACISMVEQAAIKNKISIIKDDIPEALETILADKTLFRQVVLNLLSNAIKYNKENGEVKITTKATAQDKLRIIVSDTGIGIPKEKHLEVFQPFNRLGADATDISGTGIGLSISKRLIEVMGGAIGFDSEAGKGSSFWVEVPLNNNEYLVPINESVDNTLGNLDDDLSCTSGTILYIEDNLKNLAMMQSFIKQFEKLVLITEKNAEEGIETAIREHPDLIILDINLPGMNGLEALKVLRKADTTQSIPIIALTAAATREDVEDGNLAGFAHYLTKPVQLGELLSVILSSLR
ncbi:MAG: hypothetical protein COA42_05180 [Alteromonadaceae bacterium]|nr:MAG: hypothetical protein COA42_05180 [Alteromonadaceae bacterium]